MNPPPRPGDPRVIPGVPFLLIALSVASPCLSAQAPVIPPGWVLVDDLILPESFVNGDAAYAANAWPGGIVPYDFDAAVAPANRTHARNAMADVAAAGNVTFVQRTTEQDYLLFMNCNCNAAYLGQAGGGQPVNIFNWNIKYIVVHEILHSLGYIHEQSRPDRNGFIQVNTQNIQNGYQAQFDIFPGAVTTGPYDFLSIMHYGQNFFSNGQGPTISCLPAYAQYQNQLGNQAYMTVLDAQGVASRYGAPPPPRITSIAPATANPGSAPVTLTVTGQRFCQGANGSPGLQGSRIRWDGAPLPTTYIDPEHLSATLPASSLVSPGCHQITIENPSPGGGASNVFTFSVGLTTCAPNVEWELNDPLASFSIHGVQAGGPFGPPAIVIKPYASTAPLVFEASGTGLPWDAALTAGTTVPLSQSQLWTTGDQVVNLPLATASTLFLSTGGPGSALPPFPGTLTLPVTVPSVPVVVGLQMFSLNPAHADGIAFSQAVQLESRDNNACTAGALLSLGDDAFSQRDLGFSYPHFGASFTRVFVGSNGRLTFNVGSTSALSTSLYFWAGPPSIAAFWTDLDPSQAGTVRFTTDAFGSFGACYQGVPLKNQPLAISSFSIVARAGADIVLSWPSAANPASGLVGLAPGGATGNLLPLDLSLPPHAIPPGGVPYESFSGNFDLSGRTLTFLLDASGRPVGTL